MAFDPNRFQKAWAFYREEFRRKHHRNPGLLRYHLYRMIQEPRGLESHCELHDALDPSKSFGVGHLMKTWFKVKFIIPKQDSFPKR